MKKTVLGFSVAASLQEDGFRYLVKGQSNYALKAHSCASIKGINPDKINRDSSSSDDEEDSKWDDKTTTIINYRLCPTNTCPPCKQFSKIMRSR
mmetsp:Transcript_3738/g.5080  ORF Transcript_3738/g.5080 Transcript_3738/m.5080 type:complete len:94 (+) Transcript_3738:52-333(+)